MLLVNAEVVVPRHAGSNARLHDVPQPPGVRPGPGARFEQTKRRSAFGHPAVIQCACVTAASGSPQNKHGKAGASMMPRWSPSCNPSAAVHLCFEFKARGCRNSRQALQAANWSWNWNCVTAAVPDSPGSPTNMPDGARGCYIAWTCYPVRHPPPYPQQQYSIVVFLTREINGRAINGKFTAGQSGRRLSRTPMVSSMHGHTHATRVHGVRQGWPV
jgi:hypothetical protein